MFRLIALLLFAGTCSAQASEGGRSASHSIKPFAMLDHLHTFMWMAGSTRLVCIQVLRVGGYPAVINGRKYMRSFGFSDDGRSLIAAPPCRLRDFVVCRQGATRFIASGGHESGQGTLQSRVRHNSSIR